MNDVAVVEPASRREYKTRWQRENRRQFKSTHGYSTAAHYGAGKKRWSVLSRDGFKCVRCGMTDDEHKRLWDRPITVDHKDKNRKNNSLENLQTLCLACHGNKDLIQRLRQPKAVEKKEEIMRRRAAGETYQAIADATGLSVAIAWKWVQIWKKEAA